MADKFLKLINGEIVQAEADHGNLAGLGDDDHPQYLTEGRADELYDWLGLASAVMAVHNQTGSHVTNGNSHDHAGGDGGQIDHAQLANKGSNTHAQLDAHFSEGQIYTIVGKGLVFAIGAGANGNVPYFFTIDEANPALYCRMGISGIQFINNEHNAIPVIIASNGQITISPTAVAAPLVIGANGQGQHVVGLNADVFDWYHSAAFVENVPPKGLHLRYANATTVTLDAAGIWLSDGTTGVWKTGLSGMTAVITTSGAGGLDTGSEAANTWYHVWLISKADGTNALLLSASATAPTMPSGYVYKKRVGAVRNDGSSNFVNFMQKGNRVIADTEIAIVSGGTAVAWTNVSLATLIPPTATEVQLSGAVSAGVNGSGQIWARPKNWGNGFRVNDARLSNEVNWGGSLGNPDLGSKR